MAGRKSTNNRAHVVSRLDPAKCNAYSFNKCSLVPKLVWLSAYARLCALNRDDKTRLRPELD